MSKPLSDNFLTLTRELLGMHGLYQGNEYILVDILQDSASAVLLACDETEHIQNDFQGEARRYAPKHFTLPLLSEIRPQLHPVLMDFFGQEVSEQLNQALTEP